VEGAGAERRYRARVIRLDAVMMAGTLIPIEALSESTATPTEATSSAQTCA